MLRSVHDHRFEVEVVLEPEVLLEDEVGVYVPPVE